MESIKVKKKISDMTLIVIAMIAGSLVGIVVGKPAACIGFVGDIWLNMMKMFLVPIVVCMLVKGISSMDSPEALGRIGIKIIAFYVFTTICAGALGLGVTYLINLGAGFQYTINTEEVTINAIPSIAEFFTSMFSTNIFKSFAEGDMMQVLIISVIVGVAIVLLPEGKREPVRDWFISMSDLMMSIISIALKLALIGVFCLMAKALGEYGVSLLFTIGKILIVFYGCCLLHLLIVYCGMLWGFTRIPPVEFLKKAFPTFATAFSTCSSNAVILVSMNVATENFDCEESVAGLGIPLDIVVMVGGFYRFFDMGTTSMNCLGDMSATVIIDRLEKKRTAKLNKVH